MKPTRSMLALGLIAGLAGSAHAIYIPGGPADLTVYLKNDLGSPVSGASVRIDQNGKSFMLNSDTGGMAKTSSVTRGTAFSCTVTGSGYPGYLFIRTIPNDQDFAIAQVILRPPARGANYLAEWRVGRSGVLEDPEKDSCRFNFYVKYRIDGSPIASATITLKKTDGSLYKTLTTDAGGYATALVKEGLTINVTVTASGYRTYTTGLEPGTSATTRRVNIRMSK